MKLLLRKGLKLGLNCAKLNKTKVCCQLAGAAYLLSQLDLDGWLSCNLESTDIGWEELQNTK